MLAMKRLALVALLFAASLVTGCDDLVAMCNAGGYGSPEECEARWGGE